MLSCLPRLDSSWTRRLLIALGIGIALWLLLSPKPWQTAVFQPGLKLKDVPLQDYRNVGLWLGGLGSAAILFFLAFTTSWWGGARPVPLCPVSAGHRAMEGRRLSGRWFGLLLAALLVFAVGQRWPAMKLSFWGDEGWAFCDFVHGKWKPQGKDPSLQGPIKFKQVSWEQTMFGDQSGNNHWLASILQRATLSGWRKLCGKEPWQFDERVVRLVALLPGLGSLAALAFWLRSLGRPGEGILAAALMALHPWHVRFSVEARGYALMLFFITLTLWGLANALQKGRKRDWLAFGLAQFLVMYSWKGALYPLASLNLVLAARMVLGKLPEGTERRTLVTRFLAANLFGACLFLPLAMPSQLQLRKSIDQVRGRAKPMDAVWLHNSVSEALAGMPMHEQDAANPHEISLQRLAAGSWVYGAGGVAVVALLAAGGWEWWRRNRMLAASFGAVCLSVPVALLHFKYGLRVELLPWYLLYTVPVTAVLLAGAGSFLGRKLTSVLALASQGNFLPRVSTQAACNGALLLGFAAFTAPMIRNLQTYPREDHRSAWQMTRGGHERPGFSGASNIYTAWLWRHTFLYDPRGDTHVRDAATLRQKMAAARAAQGEFYMIIGTRDLCEALCPDMMRLLNDASQFEISKTFWGTEKLNTLHVYHLRKDLPQPLHAVSAVTPAP